MFEAHKLNEIEIISWVLDTPPNMSFPMATPDIEKQGRRYLVKTNPQAVGYWGLSGLLLNKNQCRDPCFVKRLLRLIRALSP
jgi:hypothetical protein